MKLMLALIAVLSLSGCVNNFSKFYRGMSPAEVISRAGPRSQDAPKVIYTNDPKGESAKLIENGYQPIGSSDFQSAVSSRTEQNAVEQGKVVGADLIVLTSIDAGSTTTVVPLVTPNVSTAVTHVGHSTATTTLYSSDTTYVPVTVQRAEYHAGYWMKGRPLAVGLFIAALSPEDHKRIGSNSGVLVSVVVIDSPAYKADVFKGDIVLSIGGSGVGSAADFQASIKANAGKPTEFRMLRDDKPITKTILIGMP